MTNATPSRLGMINGTGADDALFLKMFSGEVLTAFSEVNVMLDRHLVRTITHGKSASFPATWKVGAKYHTPGEELLGTQKMNHAERVITIDDLLVSDVFIAKIDEAKNHYDVRSIYTSQCGYALSNTFDRNVCQTAVLAARASATVQGAPGGSVIKNPNLVTDANGALVNAMFLSAQTLDEKDVPEVGRFAVLRPAQYYKLVLNDKAINRDFTAGNGDVRTGKVFDLAGIQIVKSNHVPSTNVASGPVAYQGNFADTVGFVMHPTAVGTVKLLDLAVEGEYQISRQGTLIVAKYAVGHGILRPECAIELSKAAA